MCRAKWQSQRVRYFLRPTKLRWSRKENLREGTETPRVDLLANTIDGARTANSLASWTDKDCHAPCACAITFRRSASALSALKKNWSPSCPLNGSFQSPNCPLKGFFHSPNGIFKSQMAGWRPIFRALLNDTFLNQNNYSLNPHGFPYGPTHLKSVFRVKHIPASDVKKAIQRRCVFQKKCRQDLTWFPTVSSRLQDQVLWAPSLPCSACHSSEVRFRMNGSTLWCVRFSKVDGKIGELRQTTDQYL